MSVACSVGSFSPASSASSVRLSPENMGPRSGGWFDDNKYGGDGDGFQGGLRASTSAVVLSDEVSVCVCTCVCTVICLFMTFHFFWRGGSGNRGLDFGGMLSLPLLLSVFYGREQVFLYVLWVGRCGTTHPWG